MSDPPDSTFSVCGMLGTKPRTLPVLGTLPAELNCQLESLILNLDTQIWSSKGTSQLEGNSNKIILRHAQI